MWKCEMCKRKFDDDIMAIEVRFGYVDNKEDEEDQDQYMDFYTECAWAPLCDDCAIAYIKGDYFNEKKD